MLIPAISLAAFFAEIAATIPRPVGARVQTPSGIECTRGTERFSLQSVMELFVGIAVLDEVDQRRWKFADEVILDRKDISLGVQLLATLVGQQGYRTDIGDLVRRAVIESDSAATDILIATSEPTR